MFMCFVFTGLFLAPNNVELYSITQVSVQTHPLTTRVREHWLLQRFTGD